VVLSSDAIGIRAEADLRNAVQESAQPCDASGEEERRAESRASIEALATSSTPAGRGGHSMRSSASYFEWDSFAAAVGRELYHLAGRVLYFWWDLARTPESQQPILFLRVWFDEPRTVHVFVGDRTTGPNAVWQNGILQWLAVCQICNATGLDLKLGRHPACSGVPS